MKAVVWISKETLVGVDNHSRPKYRYAKMPPGTRGVGATDRFRIDWIDPSGRRKSERIAGTGRPSKQIADQRAEQLRALLTLGRYSEPSRAKWADFRSQFDSTELPNKRSQATRVEITADLDRFETLCRPVLLAAVDTHMIDVYKARRLKEVTWRGKPPSNATVNKELRHVRAALTKAIEWKMLDEMPTFDWLREMKRLKPFVTADDFLAMFGQCDVATLPDHLPFTPGEFWRALLTTAFCTGQRIGSLEQLRWSQVDLARMRWLSVAESNKSKRDAIVPFPEIVATLLSSITQGLDPRVFPLMPSHFKPGYCRFFLYRELRSIQAAAGIDTEKPDNRWHAMRRSYAVLNWNLLGAEELQRRMGHRSRLTTESYRVLAIEHEGSLRESYVPDGLVALMR